MAYQNWQSATRTLSKNWRDFAILQDLVPAGIQHERYAAIGLQLGLWHTGLRVHAGFCTTNLGRLGIHYHLKAKEGEILDNSLSSMRFE